MDGWQQNELRFRNIPFIRGMEKLGILPRPKQINANSGEIAIYTANDNCIISGIRIYIPWDAAASMRRKIDWGFVVYYLGYMLALFAIGLAGVYYVGS